MWTLARTTEGNEVFGDDAIGEVTTLTYTQNGRPNEQLLVHLGTIINQAGRYCGECLIEHEEYRHGDWEQIASRLYSDLFLTDHDLPGDAEKDVAEQITQWRNARLGDEGLPLD